MNIFISWSGDTSMQIAEKIKNFLPKIIQSAKPYYTPTDIEKGAKWESEINQKLSECLVGLICLTKENTEKPWILFEAGALSNRLEKAKVCPILFGVKKSEVTGPLTSFQLTEFNKKDFFKLVKSINSSLEDQSINENVLEEVFNAFFDKLEAEINFILGNSKVVLTEKALRSEKDILEEILLLVRKQNNESIFDNDDEKSLLFARGSVMRRTAIERENKFSVGDFVTHEKYGVGQVVRIIESIGGDLSIEVKFENRAQTIYFDSNNVNLKKINN